MTGDPNISNAIVEVPQAEAAAGTNKVVWSPTHGPLTVVVPPGTVDGAVVWVQTPAGNVAVTIRVSTPFAPPAPYQGAPATGPSFPPPVPGAPASGPPVAGVPASGPPFPPPAYGPPFAGGPVSGAGYPPPDSGYPPAGQPPFAPYPGQPQTFAGPPLAAPGNGRRNALIGGTVAVVLVLACCGLAGVLRGGDDDEPTGKSGGSTATAGSTAGKTATAAPVTPQQYGLALAASDAAIGATFGKLNTADSGAFAKAAPAAASTIRAEADKLRAIAPPAGAESAHGQLMLELGSMGDMIDEAASTKQECPAASPWASLLQSGWADGIREDAKKLAAADPAYKFGKFLPAAPKETNRRLKTGTFVKRANSGGSGHLKIKNGAGDTTISLVPTKGKNPKPVLTVYVRSKGTYTAKGVRDGTYRIYTASGADWDAAKKGFTRDCSFSKFDDTFKFTTTSVSASIWTITLTPVIGGNASTSDVDPNAFPK
jgi:hypothetical protein